MSPESQNALGEAQRVLQDDYPEIDAVRLSRVEARIRSEVEDSKKSWWLPIGLAAGVAAALAFVVMTGDEPVGDYNQNGVIAWDSSSPVQPNLQATLNQQPARIEQGELRFEVNRLADMKPFTLQSPHVDLMTKQARFSVAIGSEATQLTVEAGRVDVRTAEHQAWRSVRGAESFHNSKATSVQKDVRPTPQVATVAKATAATTPKVDTKPRPKTKLLPRNTQAVRAVETPAIADSTPPIEVPVPVPAAKTAATAEQVTQWMRAADAARRRSDWATARSLYQKVAKAPDHTGLQEEASLRWAETAHRTGDRQEALTALARYTKRGALLPERIALQARLQLEMGQGSAAARLITMRAPRPLALVVAEVAVAIAESGEDASKFVDLCLLVRASASSTPSLKERARAIEAKGRTKKEMIDQ